MRSVQNKHIAGRLHVCITFCGIYEKDFGTEYCVALLIVSFKLKQSRNKMVAGRLALVTGDYNIYLYLHCLGDRY